MGCHLIMLDGFVTRVDNILACDCIGLEGGGGKEPQISYL